MQEKITLDIFYTLFFCFTIADRAAGHLQTEFSSDSSNFYFCFTNSCFFWDN